MAYRDNFGGISFLHYRMLGNGWYHGEMLSFGSVQIFESAFCERLMSTWEGSTITSVNGGVSGMASVAFDCC